jgi:integrase
MDAIDDYDGWLPIRFALKIAALTFQRPGEIRGARWSEVDLDGALPSG